MSKGNFLVDLFPLKMGNLKYVARKTKNHCQLIINTCQLNVLDKIDLVSDNLCCFLDSMEYLRSNYPIELVRDEASESIHFLSTYMQLLNTNQSLYKELVNYYDKNGEQLDEEQITLCNQFLFDYKISGINLDERSKEVVLKLYSSVELAKLRYRTSLRATRREKIRLLEILFEQRYQLAVSLGYSSYSELNSTRFILNNPSMIKQFLIDEFKKINSNGRDNIEVKSDSSFHLDDVMSEIAKFYEKYFKLFLTKNLIEYKYKVIDGETGKLLGIILLDWQRQSWKSTQPAHFTLISRKMGNLLELKPIVQHLHDYKNNQRIAYVVVSISFPENKQLTRRNVTELMHEMGHAIHSCLSTTNYQCTSATRAPIDLVEIPAILNEYFGNLLNIPPVIEDYNNKTQIRLSILDQLFHSSEVGHQIGIGDWSYRMVKEVELEFGNDENVSLDWFADFEHFVDYGGAYFVYPYANCIASQLWNNYFLRSNNIYSSFECYKSKILKLGATKSGKEILKNFTNITNISKYFKMGL